MLEVSVLSFKEVSFSAYVFFCCCCCIEIVARIKSKMTYALTPICSICFCLTVICYYLTYLVLLLNTPQMYSMDS